MSDEELIELLAAICVFLFAGLIIEIKRDISQLFTVDEEGAQE